MAFRGGSEAAELPRTSGGTPSPSKSSSSPKQVPTEGDAGVVQTINGYAYPDPRCVNDWPPAGDWVGVGKDSKGKLRAVTMKQLEEFAETTSLEVAEDFPDVDIYCPPGTKVP
jgi:hypothetical protein